MIAPGTVTSEQVPSRPVYVTGLRSRHDGVVLLDCTSYEIALRALASAAGREEADVAEAIESVSSSELGASDDPARALAPLAAARLGVCGFAGFTQIRYFHGTRTVEPARFRKRGLLPVPEVVELMWDDLRRIGVDVLDGPGFDRLRGLMDAGEAGHFAWLYATKTRERMHHGPYGTLVREEHLRPGELSNHDYLAAPELAEDIIITAGEVLGIDLRTPYLEATASYLVAFDVAATRVEGAVSAACWYVRARQGGGLSRWSSWGFDGHGVAVPASAIRTVERVDPGRS